MFATKSKHLATMLCATALLSGCVNQSGDFCDVARPIYIGSTDVVDWLIENDEPLIREVISHNEMTAKCR